MTDKIVLPSKYENKGQSLGGVVENMMDANHRTGNLYEANYDRIRNAFEALRQEDRILFRNTVGYMEGLKSLSNEEKEKAARILGREGVDFGSDLTKQVARDWARHSPALDGNYRPSFAVDIGRPVRKEYYIAVAQEIEFIRSSQPEFGLALDKLLKSGEATNIANAAGWYAQTHPDQGDSVARQFGRAVSVLRGIDFDAAKTYSEIKPAAAIDGHGLS